jgi:hypothetical protein
MIPLVLIIRAGGQVRSAGKPDHAVID